MATLSDINSTLQEQNQTLKSQESQTKSLNSNISVLVKQIQGQRLDNREKEIESENRNKTKADVARGKASTSAGASGGLSIPGIAAIGGLAGSAISALGNVPLIGGLLTPLITFGRFFLKRSPFMIAVGLIAANLETIGKTFDNIVNSEVFQSLKTSAESFLKDVLGFESFPQLWEAYTLKIKQGFEGLERLTAGDFSAAEENIAGIGVLLGTFFLTFSKTRTLLFNLVKTAGSLALSAGINVGKTAGTAGKTAAQSATTLAGSAASTGRNLLGKAGTAIGSAASKASSFVKGGAIAAGSAVASMFKSTPKYTPGQFALPQSSLPVGPSTGVGGLAKAMAKYPKLFSMIGYLKKVPGLGKALAIAPLLAALAAGDGPEKIAPLAGGIIGGALGFKGGGLLGALLGAAGGPLAIATGLGGALLGGLAGDRLGTSLAQWATGQEANAMPWGLGWIDDLLNKKSDSGSSNSNQIEPTGVYAAAAAPMANKTPMTGVQSSGPSYTAVQAAGSDARRSNNTIVLPPVSNVSSNVTNVSSSNQGLVMPSQSAFDNLDPFLLTRGGY